MFLIVSLCICALGDQDPSGLSAFSLLGLESTPFGELLYNFIQLNADEPSSSEMKLNELTISLLEDLSVEESPSICDSQALVYSQIIENAQEVMKKTQKEIDNILSLMEDAKTYVPEKEQEAEQAKRWSETAQMEIDLEKTRFLEKDSNYEKNIQACEKALNLLGEQTGTTLIEEAKTSYELLQVAESDLNPAVHALVSLASHRTPENIEDIKHLLRNLMEDLWVSRRENLKNHEAALEGAQAYAEEKYYTYYNLNRQNNIILDNQIKLQQELYHKQLQVEDQSDRITAATKKNELLDKFCQIEKQRNRLVRAEKVDEVKIAQNFLEVVKNEEFLGYVIKE